MLRYVAFYRSDATIPLGDQREMVGAFLAARGAAAEAEFTDDLAAAWARSAGRAVLLVAALDCLHDNPRALWAYLDYPKVGHLNFWSVDMPDVDAMLAAILRGIADMERRAHVARGVAIGRRRCDPP